MENNELLALTNKLPASEPIIMGDIVEWINSDDAEKLTDSAIANIVDIQDSGHEGPERVSHADGLKAIEAALANMEQQSEATAHSVLWLK